MEGWFEQLKDDVWMVQVYMYDPRARGQIVALVVLVSEQVCTGNNVL